MVVKSPGSRKNNLGSSVKREEGAEEISQGATQKFWRGQGDLRESVNENSILKGAWSK